MADIARLVAEHAALPEPRQPAWGLRGIAGAGERACEARVAALLPLLRALPHVGALRILDLDCRQGYFTLAVARALAAEGIAAEVTGLDQREDNVRFCTALAAHHGIAARFACGTFDGDFAGGDDAPRLDAVLVLGARDAARGVDGESAAWVSRLRAHARVILCESAAFQRAPVAPPADGLASACAFHRRIASFSDGGDGVPRALHACSDALAWVGDRWFAFERVAERSHAGVPDAFAGQRRFFLGTDAVVKAFRGDGRHGDFNRAELAAEADVLQALPDEPGRFPKLLARADDADVVWLARTSLRGELLSERMRAPGIDRDAVARGLLGELAHLAALGFHHSDLRCWNCLVDGADVRLIDFGALVRAASPPHRLALAAVLLELANGEPDHLEPYYASPHPPSAYPPRWQALVRYLLGTPQADFSYDEALRIFGAAADGRARAVPPQAFDAGILAAAAREHSEAFQRLREYGEAIERALDGEAHARAAQLAEVASLRAHAQELEHARKSAELEHARYVESLKAALAESHTYAKSLATRLERELAAARTEREAMDAARRAAVDYSDSLNRSLQASQAYASSLEARLAREAADARAEREAQHAAQREAAAHAASLERAQREAAAHTASLESALGDARAGGAALASALEASRRESESLRAQLAQAAAGMAEGEARHARWQRRFRWLKFLWPREPDAVRKPE